MNRLNETPFSAVVEHNPLSDHLDWDGCDFKQQSIADRLDAGEAQKITVVFEIKESFLDKHPHIIETIKQGMNGHITTQFVVADFEHPLIAKFDYSDAIMAMPNILHLHLFIDAVNTMVDDIRAFFYHKISALWVLVEYEQKLVDLIITFSTLSKTLSPKDYSKKLRAAQLKWGSTRYKGLFDQVSAAFGSGKDVRAAKKKVKALSKNSCELHLSLHMAIFACREFVHSADWHHRDPFDLGLDKVVI